MMPEVATTQQMENDAKKMDNDSDEEHREDNEVTENETDVCENVDGYVGMSEICSNCHHRQSRYLTEIFGNNSMYRLKFSIVLSANIQKYRKYKHIDLEPNIMTDIALCSECKCHLTCTNVKDSKHFHTTWTAFIWRILNDMKVQNAYGNLIWCYIPNLWRHWWLEAVMSEFEDIFDCVTLTDPPSIFYDVSNDVSEFKPNVESFMLARLHTICNKHLIPTILCLWGCTEYLHRPGSLPLDVVIQRYLPKCILPITSGISTLKFIKYA
eukprot:15352368-Ditylum_brightwellii.AAC.1